MNFPQHRSKILETRDLQEKKHISKYNTSLTFSSLCPDIEVNAAAMPPTLKLLDAPHDTILELSETHVEMINAVQGNVHTCPH